ncbi:MAG: GNAT family N-acetyltransferase, partial [Sphingobacterium sp.]
MDINVRTLSKKDYRDLKTSMTEAYHGLGDVWTKENIVDLIDIFPEGQIAVEVDGKVVACALSIIINSQKTNIYDKYYSIIDDGKFDKHDPEGETLYGIEVFVHPDFRALRLGRRLYDQRKELCEQLNLQRILVGGRIPNYHEFAEQMTPRAYIEKVKRKEIYDPTLTFQLSNDFHVKKILKNYLPEDTESREVATLLEWNNIYYEPESGSRATTKQKVRI